DGLRFDLFTRPGETRRQAVERLARESATIAAAREDAPPKHPLLLTDIRKAYFVVHDIGVGPDAPRGKDHYGEKPTEHAKRRRSVAGEFVHGFLNHNGTFAVSRDLGDGRGPATVYENLQEGGWVGRYGVAIECVPIVMTPAFRAYERARDAGDARAKRPRGRRQATFEGYGDAEIACEGTKGGAIYRWPHALLDALADLYVFASARAGHLLTVTAHVEMDRNLLLSQTFFEHDKAAVAAFKGARARYRDQARDVHGDPYGLDLQVFYDKITARLNALGGLKLPPGVRYGVHPRRITTAAGETIGQSEGAAHTFPYQSSEAILRLNAAQAALVRRWSGSIRPVYGDGPKGRRVVTGFKGTPFWAE
ncbi:MAG: hypothetical protein KIT58_17955, partial [Planctomycetota bacterium]|nr:hypothetical protein [Planctomycetota bacterium]